MQIGANSTYEVNSEAGSHTGGAYSQDIGGGLTSSEQQHVPGFLRWGMDAIVSLRALADVVARRSPDAASYQISGSSSRKRPDEYHRAQYLPETPPDDADTLVLADGRELRWKIFFDEPQHEAVMRKVERTRGDAYYDNGYLKTKEGAGGQRGPNVQVFALFDPNSAEPDKPVASLRLVHGRRLTDLPSHNKAQTQVGAISKSGQRLLARRVPKGRPVAEVTDLCKTADCPTDAVQALYVRAAHASMTLGEAWVAATVAREKAGLVKVFGPRVIHSLGEPFPTGDPTAREGTTLTFLLIDTCTVVSDLLDWAEDAKEIITTEEMAGRRYSKEWRRAQDALLARETTMWLLYNGAPRSVIDRRTAERLGKLVYGRSVA